LAFEPRRRGPLPELAGITELQFRDERKAALSFALHLVRSRDKAEDVVQTAFELLATTRRWDPEKGNPLGRHIAGIVRSLVSNERTATRPRLVIAAEGEHVRQMGTETDSAEAIAIERGEQERKARAARGLLDELLARLAGLSTPIARVALARIDLVQQGILKPAEQAHRLGVPVEQVYEASRLTIRQREHLEITRTDDADREPPWTS
jgi:DNA-directed RNA polymerase specialized sigma24 family protein